MPINLLSTSHTSSPSRAPSIGASTWCDRRIKRPLSVCKGLTQKRLAPLTRRNNCDMCTVELQAASVDRRHGVRESFPTRPQHSSYARSTHHRNSA